MGNYNLNTILVLDFEFFKGGLKNYWLTPQATSDLFTQNNFIYCRCCYFETKILT
jgi:hypothetical protein